MNRVWLVVLLVVLLAACGKNTPTGANQTGAVGAVPAPTGIVSGLDSSPVVNATVTGSGSALTVAAPKFLVLDTIDRRRAIFLWPNDARMTADDTFQYIYFGNESTPLRRLGDSIHVISVVLHGQLETDTAAANAVAAGVAKDNELMAEAGVNLRFVIGGTGRLKADLSIDPDDPAFEEPYKLGAATYNSINGSLLTGARIVIHDLEQARLVLTSKHELMHVVGLAHSIHAGPMMIGFGVYYYQEFTDLDRDFVKLLYRRQPGTTFSLPGRENDRGALTSSTMKQPVKTIQVIACRL